MKQLPPLFTTLIISIFLSSCATHFNSYSYNSDNKNNKLLISKNYSEKRKLVIELLNIFNAKKQSQEVLNSMIESMPLDVRSSLKSAFNSDEMIQLIIPVYEKYLTKNELKSIIKFYKSPVGKKLLAAQPKIMKDSMIVMKVYAQKKLNEILNAEKEQEY